MPWSSEWVDPEVFLTHHGVTIYHVYKNDDLAEGVRFYWYGTSPTASDETGTDTFDVRDLDNPHGDDTGTLAGHRDLICGAIERGIVRTATGDADA